ncbi:uncharacterized protein EAF01_007062 [Botrytis porri]|uniref:uncharacterized protein n=1 Tax=Botrytis porri TaxID=87229 RepID=UPI001900EE74|nr:uncharacterized protein EAF01_007062 [Botrytis porri]KAF7901763.1 hypothetical protein EAF01_007062 [Botrytis porri]
MTIATSTSTTQKGLDIFWENKLSSDETITRPPNVLPKYMYERLIGENKPRSIVSGCSVNVSYDAAVNQCEAKVAAIVAECQRNNTKYSDNEFNLDDMEYCLRSLTVTELDTVSGGEHTRLRSSKKPTTTRTVITRAETFNLTATKGRDPACAKRISEIFDAPTFFIGHEAHVQDIRQGSEGDCWFISSLACLTVDEAFPRLIDKLCPRKARNEKVGVYGFVFYRDGEWVSEIVDDKLYLTNPDYDDCNDDRRLVWDRSHGRLDPEASRADYRKNFQTGSDALFFGSCADPNETWVPLIEKAFAKIHGDYDSISGGWPGEGVEDLTGGVATQFLTADILDKDSFWTEGLLKVGKDYIFNTGTRDYNHPDPYQLGRQGIEDDHAYSVLRAVEYQGNRLCLVKNPWGETEWNGPWSDGSKEWTPEALHALNHKFGNEGIFWMPYEDFLDRYDEIWRTRIFHCDWFNWHVAQHWTTVNVPWSGDYNETSFHFTIPVPATTVIVLSQLDTRYFSGLTDQHTYYLSFQLHSPGQKSHIARGYSSGDRSATTELFLESGTYEVHLQITGYRDDTLPRVEDVVKDNWLDRRDKLIQIGLKHDMAYAKGVIQEDFPKKKKRISLATPINLTTTSTLTPPPTPLPTPALPIPNDEADMTKDAWDASCVVGLKIYTDQTIASIGIGELAGAVKVEISPDLAKKGQGIRKLFSTLDDIFSSNLRRVKIKTKKKTLQIKWKFKDKGWKEEILLGSGRRGLWDGKVGAARQRKKEKKREKRWKM